MGYTTSTRTPWMSSSVSEVSMFIKSLSIIRVQSTSYTIVLTRKWSYWIKR